MCCSVGTNLVGALAFDCYKDDTFVSPGIRRIDWQIGASHDTHYHFAIDKQAEADGVLATSEEAFRAIDRI